MCPMRHMMCGGDAGILRSGCASAHPGCRNIKSGGRTVRSAGRTGYIIGDSYLLCMPSAAFTILYYLQKRALPCWVTTM